MAALTVHLCMSGCVWDSVDAFQKRQECGSTTSSQQSQSPKQECEWRAMEDICSSHRILLVFYQTNIEIALFKRLSPPTYILLTYN